MPAGQSQAAIRFLTFSTKVKSLMVLKILTLGYNKSEVPNGFEEYYGSKERWSKCKRRKNFRGKKPFVPPLPRTSSCRGINWEPSLTSVQELSP
ncbi:hypothetical protein ACFX2F_021441 [Malus domestica]